MKILILQDRLRSGGTERQTVLLANALAAGGDEISLVTFRPGGALDRTVNRAVDRSALQPMDLRLDWFAPGLVSRVRATRPDIVLCMGRMANCYAGRIQAAAASAGLGTRVVCTLRTGKRLPGRFRNSLSAVAHVVANSADARTAAVENHGVPPERISVIHNALVFPEEPKADDTLTLRTAQGAGPATTVLLCVAMFRREKNQRELIEIVAGLPAGLDWQLWLAGAGPTRAACEQAAVKLGLRSRVKFPGWQSNPSALYGAADIAVHASLSESLSNFIIEAQAHGVPAVANEALGMRECFIPGDTGFAIPRSDRAAFRAAIQRLSGAQPGEIRARASRARNFARTSFDPTRQVAAYRTLFARLAART